MKTIMMTAILMLSTTAFSADVCTITSFSGSLMVAGGKSSDMTVVAAECTIKADSQKKEFKNAVTWNNYPAVVDIQKAAAVKSEIISNLINLGYVPQTESLLIRK